MKSLSEVRITTSHQQIPKPRAITFLRTFSSSVFSGLLLLTTPLLARVASAQNIQQLPQLDQEPTYTVDRAVRFSISRKNEAPFDVYFINKRDAPDQKPVVKISVPARTVGDITIEFFPFIKPGDINKKNVPQTIEYSLDGNQKTLDGNSKASGLGVASNTAVSIKNATIGEPILISLPMLPSGDHQFSIISPSGLFRISNIASSLELVPILKRAQAEQAGEESNHAVQSPDETRANPGASETRVAESVQDATTDTNPNPKRGEDLHSLFGLKLERRSFSRLGQNNNHGNINELDVYYQYILRRNLGLLFDLGVNSYNLSFRNANTNTELTLHSANLGAGVSNRHHVFWGEQTLFALLFVGATEVSPSVNALDETNLEVQSNKHLRFGARAGWDANDLVGLSMQISNDPFNPLLGKLFVNLPYSWVDGVYPGLDVNLRWLHLLRTKPGENRFATSLDETDLLSRISARLPLFRLGSVALTALGGEDLEAVRFKDAFVGAALSGKFGSVHLELGGVSTIEGRPTFLFNFSY